MTGTEPFTEVNMNAKLEILKLHQTLGKAKVNPELTPEQVKQLEQMVMARAAVLADEKEQ
jgi:hypothetical protein